LRSLSPTKAKPVNIEKATEIMREEYDFTDGARGKFSRAHVQPIPPIRLEPEVLTYLTQLAKEKDTTLNILGRPSKSIAQERYRTYRDWRVNIGLEM
jgi:hypothetical protein